MPLSVEDGKRLIELEAEMARRGELPAGGAGRDLTDTLFGATTATAAPVDQWRQTLRLDDLERQYNLPAGLMTSVLRQESGGDPRVKSFAGAQGLFQFMPKTAAAYKIDPFDPQQAAPAAAKELSTLYKKYGGDVDRTLAAWNWGQGNVDRKGMTNMPSETRGFLTNVKRFLSPGVAEAASPPAPTGGRDLLATAQPGSGGGRDLTDMLFGPAPRSRLEEIEAELARRDQQATPQAPAPRTRLEELEAELARRDTQQATGGTTTGGGGRDLTDRLYGPATQPLPLVSQMPPVPATRPTPLAQPGASQGPGAPPVRLSLGDPREAASEAEARATIEAMRARLSAPPQATGSPGAEMEGNLLSDRSQVAEGGEQVPLSTAVPAALKQTAATAINAVPFAVGTLAGGPVTGAIAESILQPVAHEVNVRLGLEERGEPWFSIKGHPVDTQHILGAALPWVGPGVQAGLKVHRAGRALTAADTATQEAIDAAQATYNKAHADYLANKISYKEAEAIQTEAVKKVRALPGTYAPATPSRELYQQMVDAAPNAPVDLAPMLQQIPAWRQSVQHAGPQVGQILDKIEAMGNTTDVARLYNEVMKDLGRLTSRGNGAARGVATEMYGAVHDALEASALQVPGTAVAADVLTAARTSFRREKAVENLERIVQPGGTVVKYDNQGRLVINPAMLQNRVEKLIGQDRFFAGSFQPDELAQLRSDVGSFAGTPKIPTREPVAPLPMEMPPHVEPQLTPLINRPGRKALYGAEAVASIASGRMPSTYEFALMGADVVSQGIAKLLLAPGGRDMLRRAIRADGVLDPAIYPMIGQLGAAKEIDTYRQPKTR